MSNYLFFRRSLAGALVGLMLATPVSAQSDGHQRLIEKREAELGPFEEWPEEDQRRANQVGSAVGTTAVVAVVVVTGVLVLAFSQAAFFPE